MVIRSEGEDLGNQQPITNTNYKSVDAHRFNHCDYEYTFLVLIIIAVISVEIWLSALIQQ